MGITYAEIGIENPFQKRRMNIKTLVDSGSVFLTVPEHVAVQLGFDTAEVGMREVILEDGSRRAVPMIGPLRVYFADRYCDLSALVLRPATQTLEINPDNPFIPVALAK